MIFKQIELLNTEEQFLSSPTENECQITDLGFTLLAEKDKQQSKLK